MLCYKKKEAVSSHKQNEIKLREKEHQNRVKLLVVCMCFDCVWFAAGEKPDKTLYRILTRTSKLNEHTFACR